MLRDNPDVTRKLRALWALHVTDGLTERDLQELSSHESEYVRSWAVYLLGRGRSALGQHDAPVREWLATISRRSCGSIWRARCSAMPVGKRWDTLTGLSRTPRTPATTTSR